MYDSSLKAKWGIRTAACSLKSLEDFQQLPLSEGGAGEEVI
jgi:hypothetical protein